MNEKQKTLIYAWCFGVVLTTAILSFDWFGLPLLLIPIIFMRRSKQLAEMLKEDQDRTFTEYMTKHKRLFIGLVIFSVITYLFAFVKILYRDNRHLSAEMYFLIFAPLIPWLIVGIGQQIYLYKQYGAKT